MRIGSRIVKLRQAKHLTQKELAKGADISLSYLKRIESGNCSRPHLKTLARIAKCLGVDLPTIFQEED